MDPTLQTAGAMAQPAAAASGPSLQNALLLQAIKGGASGGAAPPMAQTQAATGMAPQMGGQMGGMGQMAPQMPTPPTNPSSMTGGVPMGGTPPMGTQMPMMQAMGGQPAMQGTDPVTSALFSPIPGQEEKNAEFLVARKAAVKADTVDDLPRIAAQLLGNRSMRGAILWNLERCAKPQAAFTITDIITRTFCLAA